MRKVGGEARRTYQDKLSNGFFKRFMSGKGLDIGFRGYEKDIVPILDSAIGIETDYPDYKDGILPFKDNSQDYIFSSHVLEHITDYQLALKEWHRVIKIGGHIITMVPHQFLYEKRKKLPSNWNSSHHRFYTPASLLKEVEESLEPNSYRIRLLEDGDKDFNYNLGPDKHSDGQYEITLVIEKIAKPVWELK